MKDWLLIAGHGQGDPGAVGNGYKEAELTREFVILLSKELLKSGKTVEIYPFQKNMVRSKDSTNYKAKQVLEIHFNSFSNSESNGTEVLIHNAYNPDKIDNKIQEVTSIFWKNRGIKKRDNLYVMNKYKTMKVPFRLLEICFISNVKDMEIYQKNKNKFAAELANEISKF